MGYGEKGAGMLQASEAVLGFKGVDDIRIRLYNFMK